MNRLIALLLVPLTFTAVAADAPEKASMRTKAGLYVDARESHDMLTKPEGREVVLIDVRDAIEIKFTGYTDMTDIHVPWKIIDVSKWDEKKQSYGGAVNENFGEDVKSRPMSFLCAAPVPRAVRLLLTSFWPWVIPMSTAWSMVLKVASPRTDRTRVRAWSPAGRIQNCPGAGSWNMT